MSDAPTNDDAGQYERLSKLQMADCKSPPTQSELLANLHETSLLIRQKPSFIM